MYAVTGQGHWSLITVVSSSNREFLSRGLEKKFIFTFVPSLFSQFFTKARSNFYNFLITILPWGAGRSGSSGVRWVLETWPILSEMESSIRFPISTGTCCLPVYLGQPSLLSCLTVHLQREGGNPAHDHVISEGKVHTQSFSLLRRALGEN